MKTLATLLALCALSHMNAHADSLYKIPLEDIDGETTSLAPYEGKVMLIVNVASKCGYTRQYAGLESLYEKYKDKGLVVLGFPCNQFGGQEPGAEADIKEFCELTFGVKFPMFAKIDVNGDDRHPLYQALAGDASPFPGNIGWNFTKFLVSKDGKILRRWASGVEPESEEIATAIESAL